MPGKYWDGLLFTASLEHDVKIGGEKVTFVLAMKSGDLGYCGPGQKIGLRALVATDGSPWYLDIPEFEDGADLHIRLLINNMRRLGDRDIERLLAQLAILGPKLLPVLSSRFRRSSGSAFT